MEKDNFYLMKNIPIPDQKSYKLQLIQKVEDFIKDDKKEQYIFYERKKSNWTYIT